MVKILVQGATGNVGCAVVKALLAKKADVLAGVRDPSKHTSGVANVPFDSCNIDQAVKSLNGVDVLVVSPPGATPSWEDRYRFAGAMALIISRARQHTLKHVIILSVPGTSTEAILFARQFLAIERAIQATGIPTTIMAMQMFMDNFPVWAQGIKQGRLCLQLAGKGKKAYSPISIADIGEAVANVALNYTAHVNKCYVLTGPQHFSGDEMAAEFSRVLGTPVEYVPVDAETCKRQFCCAGLPEWQAIGMTELFSLVDSHGDMFKPTPHLEQLLGRPPTTLSQWIRDHKTIFTGPAESKVQVEKMQQQTTMQQKPGQAAAAAGGAGTARQV